MSRVDAACDKLLVEKQRSGRTADEVELAKKLRARSPSPTPSSPTRCTSRRSRARAGSRCEAKGAKPQRLLWASTATKDPRYPDTLYVDALIGADTVNTVPPATLTAFMDHGKPASALTRDLEEAHRQIEAFAVLQLDLGEVCARLLADGVKAFETSMTTLMRVIAARRAALQESSAVSAP